MDKIGPKRISVNTADLDCFRTDLTLKYWDQGF